MHRRLDRQRFAIISIVAISANLFVAPASFFQNRYLDDVRGYTGGGIALFTLCTATPASLGLIVGGRLADMVGRRAVLAICMPISTLLIVGTFTLSAGRTMWLLALGGGLLAGAAYPAFTVYRTELFPTGNRGRANGYITALSLAGSSVGLLLVGALVHRGWSYGQSMLLVGFGQLLAAVIAYVAYPETAHLELEQINPQDALTGELRSIRQPSSRSTCVGTLQVVAACRRPSGASPRRDRRSPVLQLVGRAERIAGAVDEQARHVEAWQVLDAQRVGLAGRVQWIRDQHQPACRQRILGVTDHHRADPAAHRSAAEYQPAPHQRASPRRARSATTPVDDRVPCAQPCGTGSRRARSASARPPASIARRLECVLDEPAPGNANGVRVNGEEYGKVELRKGDHIDLGHVRLRFVAPGEDFVFDRDAQVVDVGAARSRARAGSLVG